MTYRVTDENKPAFEKRLERSKGAVSLANNILANQGWKVQQPKTIICPTAREYKEYADKGDLRISTDGKNWKVVEVKQTHRTYFSSYFPYKRLWVCSTYSFHNKKIKPSAYMIFNSERTYFVFIPVEKTFVKWNILRAAHDPERNQNYSIYWINPKNPNVKYIKVKL
jgi:hypothetical protein